MYEAHFDFSHRPFPAVPRLDSYHPAETAEIARQKLGRCIARGEGVGILIGPIGTGKTLVCQKLAAEFKYSFNVVFLESGRLATRRYVYPGMPVPNLFWIDVLMNVVDMA